MVLELMIGAVLGAGGMWAAQKYAGKAAAEVSKIEDELKAKVEWPAPEQPAPHVDPVSEPVETPKA